MRKFIVAASLGLSLVSMGASAQTSYDVMSLDEYFPRFKDAHQIMMEDISNRPISLPEKLILIQRETAKLKKVFIDERRAEYKSKSALLVKGHSCTKGGSGGKKDCGWKSVEAPVPDLYTQSAWVKVVGTNKGLQVLPNKVSLRMTRAGKGRNYGEIHAVFRYHPNAIEKRSYREAEQLFQKIAGIGVDDISEKSTYLAAADKRAAETK